MAAQWPGVQVLTCFKATQRTAAGCSVTQVNQSRPPAAGREQQLSIKQPTCKFVLTGLFDCNCPRPLSEGIGS